MEFELWDKCNKHYKEMSKKSGSKYVMPDPDTSFIDEHGNVHLAAIVYIIQAEEVAKIRDE